jgi:hypothetical protein
MNVPEDLAGAITTMHVPSEPIYYNITPSEENGSASEFVKPLRIPFIVCRGTDIASDSAKLKPGSR